MQPLIMFPESTKFVDVKRWMSSLPDEVVDNPISLGLVSQAELIILANRADTSLNNLMKLQVSLNNLMKLHVSLYYESSMYLLLCDFEDCFSFLRLCKLPLLPSSPYSKLAYHLYFIWRFNLFQKKGLREVS